jgi:hypothetical protein
MYDPLAPSSTRGVDRPVRLAARAARAMAVCAVAALLLCAPPAAVLWAGSARLVEAAGPEHVVLDTADASADEVLAVLATRFAFAVERRAPTTGQPMRYSGRLQGRLDDLIERLLRHEGHMIVRSAEAPAGIARIVLIESKPGTPAAAPLAGPIAAIKAQLKAQERQGTGN